MDELKMLGKALTGPDPSPEAVDRSRHRLQNSMRGDAPAKPRRTKRWILAGAGLVAMSAAAALVVTDPSSPNPAKEPVLSGQQVMLAAATTAESKSASTGTYWHTKLVLTTGKVTDVTETWFRRDGATWVSGAPGMVSRVAPRPLIDLTKLDYADIQRLPTDPDRLESALLKSATLPSTMDKRLATINLLQKVLSQAPAPSKVRAAAYRALAGAPHIANLGKVSGGYRLRISYDAGTETIVVNPKTAQLRVEGWSGFGGGPSPVGPALTTSGWTERLTGRVVPWTAQEPYIEKQNAEYGVQNH